MSWRWWRGPALTGLAFTCLFALFGGADANAQSTTGTIRGRVINEDGAPVADAQVVARNVATNVERTTVSNAQGLYMLVGLQPATYELSVNVIGYSAAPRQVRVLIGQTLAMDLQLQPQAIVLEGITAVGERVVEVRTPEVATNVTEEQIRSLPQQERNFLNFAALAPGVTVSSDENNKQITAGGLPSTKINVFVDGASYKNDILEGGVHGQDAAKGNPFPQIALQEFRVVTQNFKAEHQRAASAVVLATTRSGTNEFRVNGFVLGQNKGLVEQNPGIELNCAEQRETNPDFECTPKPEYERLQLGLAAGGPIMRDRLFYFAAFEGNYQDRQSIVALGDSRFRNIPVPGRSATFGSFEGTFDQPFRSSLGVAKLSWIPGENQTLDLSWNGRFETDKRGFQGTTSFESAENVRINTNVVTLQHSMTLGGWFNQAHISAQRASWKPTVVDEGAGVGLEYMGILRVGGRSTEQEFVQDRIALRNDLSRRVGSHSLKMGANVDFLNYEVAKRFNFNPTFVFDTAVSMTVPVRASYGSGDPGMDESNIQFGLFVQDDWDVTDRLQLNLGVRWDAETNQFNNEWVTPDSIRSRLAGLGYENRFTTGRDDRPIYLGAIQPRVGFSYDLFGDARTVVHGGFGIFYDREVWNHLIDERFRLNWITRNFNFTTDPDDDTRVFWDPATASLSADYLEAIVAEGSQPVTNEVFLLDNDTKPPYSHQWSFGVRQMVSDFALSAGYRGVRGYNLLTWYCGMPHPDHGFCEGGRQTAGLPYDPVLSTNEGRTWYDALDLRVERPMSRASRWGFTLGYTYAEAEQKGRHGSNDWFTLDHPGVDPADWPRRNSPVEKHRITASGIVGLPYDFLASTLIQWGSGTRFSRIVEPDVPFGWSPRQKIVDWYSETGDAFRQVDVRLEKQFAIPGTPGRVGLQVEAINVFDHDNYRGYFDLAANAGGPLANFGERQWWTADAGRRLQLGLNFEF